MIQLLFVVILSEMLMILAFLFKTPSRKLVILGLDQIKRLLRPRRGEARVRAAREAQSKGGAQAQAFTNQGGCNKLREPQRGQREVEDTAKEKKGDNAIARAPKATLYTGRSRFIDNSTCVAKANHFAPTAKIYGSYDAVLDNPNSTPSLSHSPPASTSSGQSSPPRRRRR
ncbi:hypothetical protein ACFX2I_011573 [Malus domestica]